MIVIQGPYCLVCGGKNIIQRWVNGIISWSTAGTKYGKVLKDICLDCEKGGR